MNVKQLPEWIRNRWKAGHSIIWLVTEEPYRCQEAVRAAVDRQNERISKQAEKVDFWIHDKMCGFYKGKPSIQPLNAGTTSPLRALQIMLGSQKELDDINGRAVTPAGRFEIPQGMNLERDIVFVLKDWNGVLKDDVIVQQFIKNIVHSNMHQPGYYRDGQRGQRMIVLITPTDEKPKELPELKPELVPLPDDETLGEALDNVDVEPKPNAEQRRAIVRMGRGFTYQGFEDAVGLASAQYRLDKLEEFLEVVQSEKSRVFNDLPGVLYIPPEKIQNASDFPGYEPLNQYLDENLDVDEAWLAEHAISGVTGLAVLGMPGTGKSQFALALGKRAKRPALIWNLGESQSKWVGESQHNARRILQVAQAVGAVLILDDLDKAGLNNAAQGNSGNEVTGSVLQMVLTELALPDNKMIVGFTGNRLGGFPPELLRKGRVNEVCFVDLPDFEIRHQILVTKVRQKRFDLTSSDESKLALLAEDNITDGCSGAELTSFVEDAVRRAGVTKSKRLDIDWMIEKAKTFTPLSKTPEWAGDLQKMREACKTFMLLGRSQTSCTSSGSEPSRVQRRSRRDD